MRRDIYVGEVCASCRYVVQQSELPAAIQEACLISTFQREKESLTRFLLESRLHLSYMVERVRKFAKSRAETFFRRNTP